MPKLYVPRLGDELTLAEPWKFTLVHEHRNSSLMEMLGIKFREGFRVKDEDAERGWQWVTPSDEVTLEAGSVLKVSRIYIRNGQSDFDSMTFLLKGSSVPSKLVERTMYRRNPLGKVEVVNYEVKKPKKPVRFWAKLDDANRIVFQ